MGKVIALLLIAFGASVNAEVVVGEILLDRATNKPVGELWADMDDTTLAKAAREEVIPELPKIVPIAGSVAPPPPKRLFGGTNNKNNPSSDMAVMKGKAVGMYGAGRFATGYERFGGDNKAVEKPKNQFFGAKFTQFTGKGTAAEAPANKKKLFGGTNNKNNPNSDMAVMKGKAVGMYGGGRFATGYERFGGEAKAKAAPKRFR